MRTVPRSGRGTDEDVADDVESAPTRGGRGGGRGGRASRGGRGGGAGGRGGGSSGVKEFVPTSLGVALIEGFDRMNFETSLGKPFLRKEFELKMKAICEGRTTKEAVLQESIGQYRMVFEQSQDKLNILKAVSHISSRCKRVYTC